MDVVRFQEIISILSPQNLIENSEGDGGLKAKVFKGKYEAKLEFPAVLGWGWSKGFKT